MATWFQSMRARAYGESARRLCALAACAALHCIASTIAHAQPAQSADPPRRPKLFTPAPAAAPRVQTQGIALSEVRAGLDERRELLATRHAYSVISPVPQSSFDAALAHARLLARPQDADEGDARLTFDELGEVLALALSGSIDGHGAIGAGEFPRSRPSLPVLLQPWEDAARAGPTIVLALRPNRTPLDAQHPLHTQLVAIDGIPTQQWLDAASRFVPSGTRALRDRWSLGLLSSLPLARRWLEAPAAQAPVPLASARDRPALLTLANPLDASLATVQVEVALRNVPDELTPWPARESGMLDERIAYLRLPSMIGDIAGLREVRRTLDGFARPQHASSQTTPQSSASSSAVGSAAKALIIDLRGNGGGMRDLIPLLADALLPKGHPPIVFTASRVLKLPGETELARKERTEARDIYLRDDVRLTREQRDAIDRFLTQFVPRVGVSDERFAPLYFGFLAPAREQSGLGLAGPVIEGPIVVLMDGGCFSAADVCLAALAEFPNVTLMGQPSAGGSGFAESMLFMQGKAWARLSTMATFRRDGSLFDGVGITPDVLVRAHPTDFVRGGGDAMLDEARAFVQRLLDEPAAP